MLFIPKGKDGKKYKDLLEIGTVGLEMGLSVVIGVLIGKWLDEKLGTYPWMLILWLVFGFIAGIRSVVRGVNRYKRNTQQDEDENGRTGKEESSDH